jgi:shikimate dehydrogenase
LSPRTPEAQRQRRAAVLGHPIAHSLSPALHRAAYLALGLDWTYDAIDVAEPELTAFLAGLGPEWVGLSLTMPLKTAVLPLLSVRTSSALLTGCANTVVLGADGSEGSNTDVAGIVDAVRELRLGAVGRLHTATILGAGATARSAIAALDPLDVREVVVVARRPERADDLRLLAEAVGVTLRVTGWDRAENHLGADLVISTVPAGVADPLATAVAGSSVRNLELLLDVVYAPWPSNLVTAWRERGGSVVPGQLMLLHQAAHQVRLMTGRVAPLDVMREALSRVHDLPATTG